MTYFGITRHLRVPFGQCDPAGVLFNARYFDVYDAGTVALVEAALGLDLRVIEARYGICGLAVVDTRGRFLMPLRYGDRFVASTRITRLGRSSLSLAHELRRGDDLCGSCEETRAWIGPHPDYPDLFKALAIPDDVRAALETPPEQDAGPVFD